MTLSDKLSITYFQSRLIQQRTGLKYANLFTIYLIL